MTLDKETDGTASGISMRPNVITRSQLKWLPMAVGAVVLVPAIVAGLALVLAIVNDASGFQRYRLPAWTFWLYVWTALASPIVGFGTLIFLRLTGGRWWPTGDQPNEGWVVASIATASAAILAPILWFIMIGTVFFAAGGTR